MKILFFTSSEEDYLGDSILIGLKRIYGADCVDYPKRDILYKGCQDDVLKQVRGYGFSLYSGLIEDIPVDRFSIRPKLERNYFDLIIISDPWRQFGYLLQWGMYFDWEKVAVLDPQDSDQVYPYAGLWVRNPMLWLTPRVHRRAPYFKREWTHRSRFNWWHRLLPSVVLGRFQDDPSLRKISFSFPEAKILDQVPNKTKRFARHCVDEEVQPYIDGAQTGYVFTNEADYFADLSESKFAITMKRAGWDCLRHYEIAANGCVMCFKDLEKKPETCAPHGLVPGLNCLSYSSYEELRQVTDLSDPKYQEIAYNSIEWAKQNSCTKAARRLIQMLEL